MVRKILVCLGMLMITLFPITLSAQAVNDLDSENLSQEFLDQFGTTLFGEESGNFATAVVILISLTVLSLAPALIMMMTSFIRIMIVLAFTRTALATQQMPPNQVLVGLALFMTLFIMFPTYNQMWEGAIEPYLNQDNISFEETFDQALSPLRTFMLNQMQREQSYEILVRFFEMSNESAADINTVDDIPTYVLIPAFMVSELTFAFQIGVMIFIPFIIIDIVISSILLSMGLIFLPPVLVSLPFKILLFVLVDGWTLLVTTLIEGFVI